MLCSHWNFASEHHLAFIFSTAMKYPSTSKDDIHFQVYFYDLNSFVELTKFFSQFHDITQELILVYSRGCQSWTIIYLTSSFFFR